jgi:hypothetical protein
VTFELLLLILQALLTPWLRARGADESGRGHFADLFRRTAT